MQGNNLTGVHTPLTWIHRLDPRTKLLLLAISFVMVLLPESPLVVALAAPVPLGPNSRFDHIINEIISRFARLCKNSLIEYICPHRRRCSPEELIVQAKRILIPKTIFRN